MAGERRATLDRMVLPDHTCPFGVRAKELLEEHGYEVEDNILSSREETDAFQAKHDVGTTPQVLSKASGSAEATNLHAFW